MNKISAKEIKLFTKKIIKSKKKCREFLFKTGIYTKRGNLTKPYR